MVTRLFKWFRRLRERREIQDQLLLQVVSALDQSSALAIEVTANYAKAVEEVTLLTAIVCACPSALDMLSAVRDGERINAEYAAIDREAREFLAGVEKN